MITLSHLIEAAWMIKLQSDLSSLTKNLNLDYANSTDALTDSLNSLEGIGDITTPGSLGISISSIAFILGLLLFFYGIYGVVKRIEEQSINTAPPKKDSFD